MLFDGVLEFVRVTQAASFTQAARNLGVTPSAVSKAVSRLEASLGTRLLNRTSRSVTLTGDGEIFLATAGPTVAGIQEARALFREQDTQIEGTFRLSVPSAFGPLFLDEVVRQLTMGHPGLTLEIHATDRVVDFTQERIDLALRLGDLPDSQLVAKRVLIMGFVTAASPDYIAQRGLPLTVAELEAHHLLGFRNRTRGQVRRWRFATDDGEVEVAPRRGSLVDDPLTYRALMMAGSGIGQAPSYLIANDRADGRLVPVLSDESAGSLTLSFVFPKPLGRSPRLRTVIEVFESVIHERGGLSLS